MAKREAPRLTYQVHFGGDKISIRYAFPTIIWVISPAH